LQLQQTLLAHMQICLEDYTLCFNKVTEEYTLEALLLLCFFSLVAVYVHVRKVSGIKLNDSLVHNYTKPYYPYIVIL
jgi:hypothetical protein